MTKFILDNSLLFFESPLQEEIILCHLKSKERKLGI